MAALEASRIVWQAELHQPVLSAMFITGIENWQADASVVRRWIRRVAPTYGCVPSDLPLPEDFGHRHSGGLLLKEGTEVPGEGVGPLTDAAEVEVPGEGVGPLTDALVAPWAHCLFVYVFPPIWLLPRFKRTLCPKDQSATLAISGFDGMAIKVKF